MKTWDILLRKSLTVNGMVALLIGVTGLLFLAGTILLGCSGSGVHLNSGKPDVLLVIIDTCRADHLGCYGYEKADTPVCDSLAASGIVFERCYATAPLTLPAHSSIMTGLLPLHHGVMDNGTYRLGENLHTLAEIMSGNGYSTAAVVGGYPVASKFGLARGFDTYDDRFREEWNAQKGITFFYAERRAEDVTDKAVAILKKSDPEKPMFLWVHYFDPHAPYRPPEPFASKYDDGSYAQYDGEIAYTDYEMGRLIGSFREIRGQSKGFIVVLTADHGESLGEHGEETHSEFLFDATLRVPLIISGWKGAPVGTRIHENVSGVDIMPTIIDLSGVVNRVETDGISLLSFFRTDMVGMRTGKEMGEVSKERLLYAETHHPRIHYGWHELNSIRNGEWKYIEGAEPLLFNTVEDPGETGNLAEKKPDLARQMSRELHEFITKNSSLKSAEEVKPDSLDRERLASLGYVTESGNKESVVDREIVTIAMRAEMLRLFDEAKEAMKDGKTDRAVAILDSIISIEPYSKKALFLKGAALGSSGDYQGARKSFRKALELDPSDGRIIENLAFIDYSEGKLDTALDKFRQVVRMLPNDEKAYRFIVDIYNRRGDTEGALEVAREWAGELPMSWEAFWNVGLFELNLNHENKAVAALERALELSPPERAVREIRKSLQKAESYR